MLKFLVDAGVGRSVEEALSQQHDVLSVLSFNAGFPDEEILKLAHQQQRIIVTMDKDFGELVFRGKLPHYGVLLLRLESATAAERTSVVNQILANFSGRLCGNFCTYQNGQLRIRDGKPHS